MENSSTTPRTPEHLNSSACRIAFSEGKGRGVFASQAIPAHTLVEISPVLLFDKEEYAEHGKYTALDHYTFNWPDGRMALALGLGSLFNHSQTPNVNFVRDTHTDSIRYTTVRIIQPNEELCIFYGYNLWFRPPGVTTVDSEGSSDEAEGREADEWGGLSAIVDDRNPFLDGDPLDILAEDELPFARIKVMPDNEEEDDESSIRTILAWVVDIPDSRAITTLLKWTKQSGLETPDLSHLKRIRRSEGMATLLLCKWSDSPAPPIPAQFSLPPPYTVCVPETVALSLTALRLKAAMWPTVYAPRRKGEPEPWSRGKAAWAWEAVEAMKAEARRARKDGELPIVSYVPLPFARVEDESDGSALSFIARDTRRSAAHPLRHSVLNLVRQIADWRSTSVPVPRASPAIGPSTLSLPPALSGDLDPPATSRNGSHYLLTGLALFTTHEPCIMCCMALLHSRVKEVVYVVPMDQTGGCGGSSGHGTCVPRLKGVNHRFVIARWNAKLGDSDGVERLKIAADVDA